MATGRGGGTIQEVHPQTPLGRAKIVNAASGHTRAHFAQLVQPSASASCTG